MGIASTLDSVTIIPGDKKGNRRRQIKKAELVLLSGKELLVTHWKNPKKNYKLASRIIKHFNKNHKKKELIARTSWLPFIVFKIKQ